MLPLQADIGLGPKAREDNFGFMHDNKPAPLQLERIDEDATLQGGLASDGWDAPWPTPYSPLLARRSTN
jgi:hypothetical protein